MSEFTFLTQEQFFEDDKLDIFKKRGTMAAVTDFSILLGAYVSNYHVDGDSSLEGRTGYYWTRSDDGDNDARVVSEFGYRYYRDVYDRNGGARPALPFSSIDRIPTNGVSGRRASDGILEVEYGYYPQKAVSKDMQSRLEQAYTRRTLSKTRNTYTTDSVKYDEYSTPFNAKTHEEYEYNGKRYVRVEVNSGKSQYTLSNGENYRDGDSVWVEVAPVKWLVDEKARTMITEKLIFSGVQFNREKNYHTRDFDKTDIKAFMDRYLARDLVQARGLESVDRNREDSEGFAPRKSRLQKLNPDKTGHAERTRMTDTEIIQNWIEAGESVLLRGPSGIGKTERIKTLYPDLIYMKLTNNMFPEKVVGRTKYSTRFCKNSYYARSNRRRKKISGRKYTKHI